MIQWCYPFQSKVLVTMKGKMKVKVLLQFISYPIALVCDITEMYLSIDNHPDDWKYLKILWKNLDLTPTSDILYSTECCLASIHGTNVLSRVYAKKYTKSIIDEVKCCVGTTVHGQHNGFRDKDKNQAVLQTVNNLAINWNSCEKIVA